MEKKKKKRGRDFSRQWKHMFNRSKICAGWIGFFRSVNYTRIGTQYRYCIGSAPSILQSQAILVRLLLDGNRWFVILPVLCRNILLCLKAVHAECRWQSCEWPHPQLHLCHLFDVWNLLLPQYPLSCGSGLHTWVPSEVKKCLFVLINK